MFKKLFNDLLGDDENKKKEEDKLNAQQETHKKNDEYDEQYEEDEEDEEEDDDAYFGVEETDEERQKRILASVNPGVQLHPETLHGLHYTEEQFDAEVEKRLQEKLNDPDMAESEYDISAAWRNALRTDVYKEWTGANDELAGQFSWANSLKYQGFSTMANAKADDDNPLLAPVHGLTFYDYSAMCSKLANGTTEAQVFKAMGIDKVIFEELNTIWPKRMQQDTTFTLASLMGQYYADADNHPKLQNLNDSAAGEMSADNVKLIMEDELYYAELAGAREAAYEYGLDGAQWVVENHGIPLGDFQKAAMKHMQSHNALTNPRKMEELINFQNAFKEQYATKFAEEQGGNVADDIEF